MYATILTILFFKNDGCYQNRMQRNWTKIRSLIKSTWLAMVSRFYSTTRIYDTINGIVKHTNQPFCVIYDSPAQVLCIYIMAMEFQSTIFWLASHQKTRRRWIIKLQSFTTSVDESPDTSYVYLIICTLCGFDFYNEAN